MFLGIPLMVMHSHKISSRQVPGYTPYSWAPVMGNGTDPVSITTTSGQMYNETAWVTDKDQYKRDLDNSIVELANNATSISASINSGRFISSSNSLDPTTGKRTIIYVVQAPSVPTGSTWFQIDKFTGIDLGSIPLLKDVNTLESDIAVTVNH